MTHRKFLIVGVVLILNHTLLGASSEEKGKMEVAAFLQAQASQLASSSTTVPLSSGESRYKLQAGDTLEINFSFTPELNLTVPIGPDGFGAFQQIGPLALSGLTLPQACEAIKKAYVGLLNDPVFTLTLKDFEKPSFIVGGWLNHPGKFELRTPTTVSMAIAIAGGFSPKSKHSQVLLFRRATDKWLEVTQLDMKKKFKEGDLSEDPLLKPGDMIYVPQNAYSKYEKYIPVPSVGMGFYPVVSF
jgi:protein involved in polysaccharide export with SLBB domain